MSPWNDPRGRYSWFKALIFAAALAPALWLAWRAAAGWLGPRPWTEAIHRSGDWSLRFLWLSLALTPIRLLFPAAARVMIARRLLGVTALAYALLHLALYVGDQAADWGKIFTEIAVRPYLTIGFVAVVGLAALGLTSFDQAIRWLGGRRWRALHRTVYVLAALGALHFYLQSKLDATEPTLMAGALIWLLAARLPVAPRLGSVWKAVCLALIAAAATAGVETLWIGLKTGAPLQLIFAANWDADLWPRPAHWALLSGLAVAVGAALASGVPGLIRQHARIKAQSGDGPLPFRR